MHDDGNTTGTAPQKMDVEVSSSQAGQPTLPDGAATAAITSDGLDPLDPTALPPLPEAPVRPPRRTRQPRPRTARAARTVHLGVRVLPSERTRLTAAAKRAGYRNASSWCRGLLLAACDGGRLPTLDAEALAEVARLRRDLNSGIGSNLNQVVAHANSLARAGQPTDGDGLLRATDAARAALEALYGELDRLLAPHGRA